jgi:hypothetical protein
MRKMIKWMTMMMISKSRKGKGLKKVVGLVLTMMMMMKMSSNMPLRLLGFILCTRHREIVAKKTNSKMTSLGDQQHKHRGKEVRQVTSE